MYQFNLIRPLVCHTQGHSAYFSLSTNESAGFGDLAFMFGVSKQEDFTHVSKMHPFLFLSRILSAYLVAVQSNPENPILKICFKT